MSDPKVRGEIVLCAVGLVCVLTTTCAAATRDLRPNIILCMGDDHAWDETGYNGHPHLKTPVLDEMAATGLRLDRFYSASPVCS
ncbi:MAG: sulfatase-like hydrolase/transferase, partial [Planctomycetes bacterium]|nr:sulfatase-like hydrolase/transferase [Planctomycetota bacterium]